MQADFASIGYRKGVPMGGDLTRHAIAAAPSFMVAASRDPDGANLDRVQIIKGWLDANGETEEQIFDVALSDDRSANWSGQIPPVGNTVDIANATYSNSIGDPELTAVWTDPDFDLRAACILLCQSYSDSYAALDAYDRQIFWCGHRSPCARYHSGSRLFVTYLVHPMTAALTQ